MTLRLASTHSGQRDRRALPRPAAARIERKDMNHVTPVSERASARMAIAQRLPGDISNPAARCEGHPAIRAGQGKHLPDPPGTNVHHVYVVTTMPRIDRPQEPAVWRERCTRRKVPHRAQTPNRAQQPAVTRDPNPRTDLPPANRSALPRHSRTARCRHQPHRRDRERTTQHAETQSRLSTDRKLGGPPSAMLRRGGHARADAS